MLAVFQDAYRTFQKDLRLIKPPDKFTFTPEAQQETELSDMRDRLRESEAVQSKLNGRLSARLLEDYM